MSNPFDHSPEAGVVYVLLEDHIDDQRLCAEVAISIIEQLRRKYRFVPLRLRNQKPKRKWTRGDLKP